jgi:hypothetical protein
VDVMTFYREDTLLISDIRLALPRVLDGLLVNFAIEAGYKAVSQQSVGMYENKSECKDVGRECGLRFDVATVVHLMRRVLTVSDEDEMCITASAAIFLTSVTEYVTAELLEQAIKNVTKEGLDVVMSRTHFAKAIQGDHELYGSVNQANITSDATLFNIIPIK